MGSDSARAHALASVLRILALAPSCVFAQSGRPAAPPGAGVTGAGTLIQEAEPVTPPLPMATGPALSVPATPAAAGPDSAPFKVNALRITGNTVFDAPTLHALVAQAEAQELTVRQLTELAGRISNFYHAHGQPFARAILPAQTIEGGVVTIEVLEARYDSISLENRSRVREAVLRAALQSLQAGQLIAGPALDRALLRVSDLPGVTPNATLAPGATIGTSSLRVTATSAPLVTGSVSVDNYGDRYTGDVRAGGTVTLTEPLGRGDVLSANVLSSGSGLQDGRVSYDAVVDGTGTRVGASFSQLHYLLGDTLQALDGHGIAQVESGWLKQPVVRTATVNLSGQIEFDHKRLDDDLGASDIHTDRHLDDWSASLAGDWRDRLLAGGVNSWSVGGTAGTLGFDNAAARNADAFTARTEGHYVRWSASVARLQTLGSPGCGVPRGLGAVGESESGSRREARRGRTLFRAGVCGERRVRRHRVLWQPRISA